MFLLVNYKHYFVRLLIKESNYLMLCKILKRFDFKKKRSIKLIETI